MRAFFFGFFCLHGLGRGRFQGVFPCGNKRICRIPGRLPGPGRPPAKTGVCNGIPAPGRIVHAPWAEFKYKGDVWADGITEKGEYDTREAWMFARQSDVLDVKIGRQVLTSLHLKVLTWSIHPGLIRTGTLQENMSLTGTWNRSELAGRDNLRGGTDSRPVVQG